MRTVIPEQVVWHCDVCEQMVTQKHRPPYWTEFSLKRDAYDMNNVACADASINMAMCQDCSNELASFVNGMAEKRR
jgi:hypothetical protein